MTDPVVVVGAGIAGSAAAAALGQAGADVVLLDAAPHLPYDRPPLSKQVLVGGLGEPGIDLKEPGWWEAHGVDLRCGTAVESVEGRTLGLAGGDTIAWSSLVLATGGRPRALTVPGSELSGVVSVNDVRGALACAEALDTAQEVVIVGAGFIGCEAASAIRATGRSVTVLEAGTHPLVHAVGSQVADWLRSLHEEAGVRLLTGAVVEALEGDGGVKAVHTADGGQHPADLVIVAIGIEPRYGLAEAAGCALDGGVLVDDHMRTSVEDVLAVGDIARYPSRFAPGPYRCEHYNVAVGHGAAAASTILGEDEPYDALPTYWTDQYGLTVNACGPTELADEVTVEGDLAGRDFLATYRRDGEVVAGLACGHRREYRALRRGLASLDADR